jgi:hypothetical protein
MTSVNQLLDRNARSKEGWRVGDPGKSEFVSKKDSFVWASTEPNNTAGDEVTVIVSKRGLSDYSIGHVATPACEIDYKFSTNLQKRRTNRAQIFKNNWPMKLTNLFQDLSTVHGCFENFTENSLSRCAIR